MHGCCPTIYDGDTIILSLSIIVTSVKTWHIFIPCFVAIRQRKLILMWRLLSIEERQTGTCVCLHTLRGVKTFCILDKGIDTYP